MPKILSIEESNALVNPARFRAIEETRDFEERAERLRRSRNKRYRRSNAIAETSSVCGDRTENTPTLRKDTKVKNRIERERADYAYLLERNRGLRLPIGEDGDVTNALAVLTHYRYIMASRKKLPFLQ